MKLFITNQNRSERIVRFIVSLFLLPTPFVLECTTYTMILGILGGFYYLIQWSEHVIFIES